MIEAGSRPQEINPGRLTELFVSQLKLCNVQAGETIAILSDHTTRKDYINSTFAAAQSLGANVYNMEVNAVPSWTKVGIATVGACKGTKEAIAAADMMICFHIPLFTTWLQEVRDAGTRVLMIIDAPDDLEQLQSPSGLKEACLYADELYKNTTNVHVTREDGTDFRYTRGQYGVMTQYGFSEEPGRFDHWGVGLVHTFPDEGSAEGTVILSPGDMVILPYNRYIHDEVKLEIREGFIRSIDGGLDAKLMADWLADGKKNDDDLDPYAISHLGWGLNPQCLWYGRELAGDIPERSRAAARSFPGNFLFSTGPNNQGKGSGNRDTKGHYDVPMRDCTIALDGTVIVEKGKIIDPNMIVKRVRR